MRYKLFFGHFPHNSQRKKLFPKNVIFGDPKNTFFANKTRATYARVTKTIIFDAPQAYA